MMKKRTAEDREEQALGSITVRTEHYHTIRVCPSEYDPEKAAYVEEAKRRIARKFDLACQTSSERATEREDRLTRAVFPRGRKE